MEHLHRQLGRPLVEVWQMDKQTGGETDMLIDRQDNGKSDP